MQKQLKYTMLGEQLMTLLYINIIESYLVIRRNKLLIHIKMWMDHKSIMLSDKIQTQKMTYHNFYKIF